MIEYKRALHTNLVEISTAHDVIDTDFDSLATQFAADTQQLTQFCILVTIHRLEGINPLIFWKDPRFGFIHVKNFSRAAILVEAQWVQIFERVVESILTAEIRVFSPVNNTDRTLSPDGGLLGTLIKLLFNFHPFCRKTRAEENGCLCPFEQLNGFRYHDDWLRNLLIATSLNGRRPLPQSTQTK